MPETVLASLNRPESITVFVVDDEHVIAATLAMILKTQGFDAKPFYQEHVALQAAQIESPALRRHCNPDWRQKQCPLPSIAKAKG